MNEYMYKQYKITRNDDEIIIMDRNGKNNKIKLNIMPQMLGKINLPLSNACTLKCLYCSEAEYRGTSSVMPEKVAYKIIDEYLSYVKKNPTIYSVRLSFDYGGEPVCQLNLLESVSNYFRNACLKTGKIPIVQITTNAAWDGKLSARVIRCADEIIVSIDGYKELHEKYRIHISNKSVFNQIIANAIKIYESGKLKNISSVITTDTIENKEEYISFLAQKFPGAKVKMSAVILTGDAKANHIKRISPPEWKIFMEEARTLSDGKLEVMDSKPEKRLDILYEYGCEHMRMINWFCWLNGKITCCTDRDTDTYVIGRLCDNEVIMDYNLMNNLALENHVSNISKCKECLARFYCTGGCPLIRDNMINCNRRLNKYAELLVKAAGL